LLLAGLLQILFKTELNIEFILLQLQDPQHLLFQVSAPDCTQVFLANPQTLLNTLLLLVVVVVEAVLEEEEELEV
jgi:hypothetical protein